MTCKPLVIRADAVRALNESARSLLLRPTPMQQQRFDALGIRKDARSQLAEGGVVGTYFERELEYIHAEVYEEELPPNNALEHFPVSPDIDVGAQTHTYRMKQFLGESDFIGDAVNDLPSVDVAGLEVTSGLREIGNHFSYTIFEILAGAFAGRSLDRDRASSAREANERKLNAIGWFGDQSYNLRGFLTETYIPMINCPVDLADPAVAQSTVRYYLGLVADYPHRITLQNARPDKMLTGSRLMHRLTNDLHDENSGGGLTLQKFFLGANRFVRTMEECWELDDPGARNDLPGASAVESGYDHVIVYPANKKYVRHELPQDHTPMPAEQDGFRMKVYTWAKTGGMTFPYPWHCCILRFPRTQEFF